MVSLRKAKGEDMHFIKEKIEEFKLDPEDLQENQFIIAEESNKTVGFGRLKPYNDAVEIGSLGVIPKYRRKGIARTIINELIKKGPKKLYATTDIPKLMEHFGFIPSTNPPKSIKQKLEICKIRKGIVAMELTKND
ncbi:MAG: GNAT family N-acetyltransferase [Candidatus Woesearchaeota archaeon]|jgi:N-acetylglutamate synthase-like GNAT family acetyltransferase|nr:GNAT family N-acetyltransferase [Candidatus Woesearchaeota archaeon]